MGCQSGRGVCDLHAKFLVIQYKRQYHKIHALIPSPFHFQGASLFLLANFPLKELHLVEFGDTTTIKEVEMPLKNSISLIRKISQEDNFIHEQVL